MTDTAIREMVLEALWAMHRVEVAAVLTGIVYVILAARENIWCWFFGIISAGLSIYLFIISRLYAESVLYFYYVLAGIYGWYAWRKRSDNNELKISVWPISYHLLALLLGVILSFGLATLLRTYTDAALPLVDSHTTIFSFIATFMVTRKVLENWLYWIVIDAVSVWLYWSRDLYLYAILMLAYSIIAVWGLLAWKKQYGKEVI